MFALAALSIVAACGPAHAHAVQNDTSFTSDVLNRAITFVFGEQDARWPRKIASCATTLGPTKCLNAFSVWRADNALDSFEKYGGCRSSFKDDLQKFPWEAFKNTTEDDLEDKLSDNTAKLLQLKSLKLTLIPGYLFELDLRRNGSLNVDVYRKNDGVEEARGKMKKFQKKFYAMVPFLLIPGLIMSAILPFVLPALKMSVMFVGMLNQMAFTGAVFSLLRDNAFNDYYEKKIIYSNKGYKNEKHAPAHPVYEEEEPVQIEEYHTHDFDSGFYHDTSGAGSNIHVQHALPASNKAYDAASNNNGAPIRHYAGFNENTHFHNTAPNDFVEQHKFASHGGSNDDWSTKISNHGVRNDFVGLNHFSNDASPNSFKELNLHKTPVSVFDDENGFSRHAAINGYSDMEEEPTDNDWINQYYGGEGLSDVVGGHTHYNSFRRKSSNTRRKSRLK